ncbi:MAG: hypothetical protein Q8R28_07290 [Dehalococcoidia bacterium]|nr:hypothetical protein [Dehalococcoidia bacterium]
MRTLKAALKVVGIGLVMAAVVQELRKKPTERTWRGRLTFSIPYDFTIPSVERIKEAYWNTQDDHIITDRVLGVGWGVNVHALLRKMGCCQNPTETDGEQS